MLGPMPDLIFAIEDNLTAVAGDACMSFHDLYLFTVRRVYRFSGSSLLTLCRLSMSINVAFGEFRQRLVSVLFFAQSQIEQRDRLV
jgi:hypothetical protein